MKWNETFERGLSQLLARLIWREKNFLLRQFLRQSCLNWRKSVDFVDFCPLQSTRMNVHLTLISLKMAVYCGQQTKYATIR